MLLADGRLMMRHMTEVIAATAAADLPSARSRLPAFPAEVNEHRMMHLFASILLPSLNRSFEQQFRFRTDMTLAATSLAARQYALGHNGKFPEQLADLAPQYLPAVPLDPMTSRQAARLHQRRRARLGSRRQPDHLQRRRKRHRRRRQRAAIAQIQQARWDRWGTQDAVVHLTQQPRKPDEGEDAGKPPKSPPTVPAE